MVVASAASRPAAALDHGLPGICGLTEGAPLGNVDAVDIVTPSPTHAALVRRRLPHAHVLVEKPLAYTAAEARALGREARRRRAAS